MEQKKVLVVDNGTKYMQNLTEKINSHAKEHSKGKKITIDKVDVSKLKSLDNIKDYDAIILSGSTHRGHKNTGHDYILKNAKDDAYIVGVCHGHQSIAHIYGGIVEKLDDYEVGNKEITITKDDDVIGKKGKMSIYKNHKYAVTELPSELEVIAESKVGRKTIIEAFKHKTKNIYGIQGHPEKGGKAEQILYNALNKAYK